jgi:hypothetical protein
MHLLTSKIEKKYVKCFLLVYLYKFAPLKEVNAPPPKKKIFCHGTRNQEPKTSSETVPLKGLSHEIEMNYKWYDSMEPK